MGEPLIAASTSEGRAAKPSAGLAVVIASTVPLVSAILGTGVPWLAVALVGAWALLALSPRFLFVALVLLVAMRLSLIHI